MNKKRDACEKMELFILSKWSEATNNPLGSISELLSGVRYKTTSEIISMDFNNIFYNRILFPETSAERTVHWFMYGRRFLLPPQYFNCRCQSIILESKEDFKREYECSFAPDERAVALNDRLVKYYKVAIHKVTSDCIKENYREFKQWCDERGYTQEEVSRAKRNLK